MTILNDGTVVPSYLQTQNRGEARGWNDNLTDLTLRFGEVKALVYPDDQLSYGKKALEYVVDVQYRDGSGNTVTSVYRGVTTSTLFGGTADCFRATLRPDSSKDREAVGVGSKVVLLCISGDQQRALILGGVQDLKDDGQAKQADGHNLFFEFNGVRFTVDKDGQPTLLFRGATAVDGTLNQGVDSQASGTKIAITRDGNLTVATAGDQQLLRLNHRDRKIEIVADNQWSCRVNGDLKIEAGRGVDISTSLGGVGIQALQNVTIRSLGVRVGAASEAWMLGTTYRIAEVIMHTQLSAGFLTLQGLTQSLGGILQATAVLNAVPIVGGLLALPGFTMASAMLLGPIPAMLAQMATAIQTFEGGAPTYLSVRNSGD